MSLSTQRQGQIGVNIVENIILRDWECRWQPLDSVNDDGIDGLIFLEKGGEMTGQIIYAQVKCTKRKINKKGTINISVSQKKLEKSRRRWGRLIGATILIHVDPTSLKAHWVNLLEPDTYEGYQIKVSSKNTFDKNAHREISALCGTLHRDLLLKRIDTDIEDFKYLKENSHTQKSARQSYRKLNSSGIKLSDVSTNISFTREGWRHITRRSRRRLTQLQSFSLLGVVEKMIRASSMKDLSFLGSAPKGGDLYSLTAMVTFPFRQAAPVRIILIKRTNNCGEVNFSFRSIYEPRRRRTVNGLK